MPNRYRPGVSSAKARSRTASRRCTPWAARRRWLGARRRSSYCCGAGSEAKSGEGQVVLLSGEPGIGKSRITAALQQRLAGEPHTRLRYFCSPHHQDSALHPTIAQLERAAGFAREDTPEIKLTKLETLLAPTRPSDEDVALLAELLSIPAAATGRYRAPNLTPQRKKEQTFEALLRQLATLTRQRPVLMVFEDAHWIDPTSRELLDLVVERIQRSSALLLITFRPEFSPPWTGQAHVTTLTLNRLDQRESAALAQRIAGNSLALPAEAVDEIVERTDGVPLFVEELTKAVVEANEHECGAKLVLSGTPAAARAVPATLHASLMARLDRLGPAAKEVAQVGAAIGREFSYELLAAVAAPRNETEVRNALGRLVEAGLLFQHDTPPEASYAFKHALVQDAAYSTLLRKQHRQLHRSIAERLEKYYPAVVQGQPELLAHHCSEAGLHQSAITYWTAAGERAVRRAANTEAVRHFRRALALLDAEPDTPECATAEIKILAQLGPAMMSAQGWTAPEVETVYDRALQLARAMDSSADLVAPLVGLWLFHNTRGEFGKARRVDPGAVPGRPYVERPQSFASGAPRRLADTDVVRRFCHRLQARRTGPLSVRRAAASTSRLPVYRTRSGRVCSCARCDHRVGAGLSGAGSAACRQRDAACAAIGTCAHSRPCSLVRM